MKESYTGKNNANTRKYYTDLVFDGSNAEYSGDMNLLDDLNYSHRESPELIRLSNLADKSRENDVALGRRSYNSKITIEAERKFQKAHMEYIRDRHVEAMDNNGRSIDDYDPSETEIKEMKLRLKKVDSMNMWDRAFLSINKEASGGGFFDPHMIDRYKTKVDSPVLNGKGDYSLEMGKNYKKARRERANSLVDYGKLRLSPKLGIGPADSKPKTRTWGDFAKSL